jgi:deoxyribonuclease-4
MLFSELPEEKAKNLHIHFSKIQYGNSGEVRHLNFSDPGYGPGFAPLARILKERGMTPVVVCESADDMADDALAMKAEYDRL